MVVINLCYYNHFSQDQRNKGKSNDKRRVELVEKGVDWGGISCKCDLSINIAFSKTAISCFPRRLEQDVSLEESRHGHASSCAFKRAEEGPSALSSDEKTFTYVCFC